MILRIHRLFQNIVRVLRWLPVIWRDREYDYSFFLQILSFKLKLMEEFYRSERALSADRKNVATKMRTCHLLCERLIKDEYYHMLGRKLEMHCLEDGKFGIKTLDEGCKFGICSDWIHYESYMQKQDIRYLCKLIEKYIFEWWD